MYLSEKVVFIKAASSRWIPLLRADESLCLPKLKSITVLLHDFSIVKAGSLLTLLRLDCSFEVLLN